MFAAPLMVLSGYLTETALRSGDRRALRNTGRTVVGMSVVGTTAIPRSGFPAALPIGLWLLLRARR